MQNQVKHLKAVITGFWSRNLLFANVVSAGAICGFGDVIQQKLEGAKKYDWKRTGRMAIVGFVVGIPTHYFYTFLDRKFVGTTASTVSMRVVMDEIFMAPLSITSFYLG